MVTEQEKVAVISQQMRTLDVESLAPIAELTGALVNLPSIISGSWVADLPTMTCHHLENKMILQFVKDGKSLKPEIKDMPLKLLSTITKKPTNLSHLQDADFG
jgi:hypothetical protein